MSTVRYPEYRSYDQPTFNELPAHWRAVRGRHLVTIQTGSGDTVDAEDDGEYPFYVRSDTPLRSSGWEFNAPAVLTAGDGAGVGKVFHLVSGRFMAHQRVYVLHDFHGVTPEFFFYAFSSMFHLMALDGSAKSTVDSVRRHMIADMPFGVPPLDEQRAIADYLDRETAQIDALVAKQEEFIGLLRKRRSGVVDAAVLGQQCRGIRADSRGGAMPGAVRRLESLPAGWKTIPAKGAFVERRQKSLPTDVHLTPSQKFGVLPQADYMRITGSKVVLNLEGQDNMKHVGVNDFIIHLRSFQGGLEWSGLVGKVSMAYTVLTPRTNEICPRYFRWQLKSDAYIRELRSTTDQLRDGQSIKYSTFAKIPLALPPLDEQHAIADYLDQESSRIDALIAKAEEHIALAKERRSALITAAVTGQIDARAEAQRAG